MDKKSYDAQIEKLKRLVKGKETEELEGIRKDPLRRLLILLQNYSYERRLQLKGTITHSIIDGFVLDHDIAEQFIWFDKGIK